MISFRILQSMRFCTAISHDQYMTVYLLELKKNQLLIDVYYRFMILKIVVVLYVNYIPMLVVRTYPGRHNSNRQDNRKMYK